MGAMKDKAIELHNMTSNELCERLVRFFSAYETFWTGILRDEAQEAAWAALELQNRYGSQAFRFTHAEAKLAADAAMRVEGHETVMALLRAAEVIEKQKHEIESRKIADQLKDLFPMSPTRDDLLKERDTLSEQLSEANRYNVRRIKELDEQLQAEKRCTEAYRAKAAKSHDEIVRLEGINRHQSALIRALRDCNAELDRQRYDGDSQREDSPR